MTIGEAIALAVEDKQPPKPALAVKPKSRTGAHRQGS
jgi:hypothetical protein